MVSLDNLPAPYSVERILVSERYDEDTKDHDVALLKLAAPVEFDGRSERRNSQNFPIRIHVPASKNPKRSKTGGGLTANGVKI